MSLEIPPGTGYHERTPPRACGRCRYYRESTEDYNIEWPRCETDNREIILDFVDAVTGTCEAWTKKTKGSEQ